MKTILYIHGMGGGADSRIPSVLNGWFRKHRRDIRVVVRTYDFHPDRAAEQIRAWYEELQPALVIGESLGANHALALYRRRSPGCGATALRGSRESDPSGGMQPACPTPSGLAPVRAGSQAGAAVDFGEHSPEGVKFSALRSPRPSRPPSTAP